MGTVRQLEAGDGEKRRTGRLALAACLTAFALNSPAFALDCRQVDSAGHELTVCRADPPRDSIQLFLNDENGRPFRTIAALEKSLAAHGKQIHYRLSNTSTSRHVRNGVGVDDAGKVIFAVSDSPLTLYEFAVAFRDDLHCPSALYLDGSVTSVYVPALNQRIQRADIGPILAVVE